MRPDILDNSTRFLLPEPPFQPRQIYVWFVFFFLPSLAAAPLANLTVVLASGLPP